LQHGDEDEFMSQDENDHGSHDDHGEPGPSDCGPEVLLHTNQAPASPSLPPDGKKSPQSLIASLLAAKEYTRAIEELTSSVRLCSAEHAEHRRDLLLQRSGAYCEYGNYLRNIPATYSERRAIFAPDPMTLATSALKDADVALRFVALPVAEAHAARGDALVMLERWNDAAEAYKLALLHSCDDMQLTAKLQACVQEITTAKSALSPEAEPRQMTASSPPEPENEEPRTLKRRCFEATVAAQAILPDGAECPLCLKLLWEPVTTPCGHTFCKPCFNRCRDHGTSKCPSCRRVLHVGRDLPVTIVLRNLLQAAFPEDYQGRAAEEAEVTGLSPSEGDVLTLPLFVMCAMLPGETMALNVFEPRYRLMVRRVLEGSRRFGMATVNHSHQLHDVACEVEIVESEQLPDGRFYIEIKGKRRFRPMDPGEQDGYRTARPEWIEDVAPESGSMEEMMLATEAQNVENLARNWVERMQLLGQTGRGIAQLLSRVGEMPSSSEREKMSFWVSNLLLPLLNERHDLKINMLRTTSTLERFRMCNEMLQRLHNAQANGCCIM
jgi:Lon protease-like protein